MNQFIHYDWTPIMIRSTIGTVGFTLKWNINWMYVHAFSSIFLQIKLVLHSDKEILELFKLNVSEYEAIDHANFKYCHNDWWQGVIFTRKKTKIFLH